MLSFILDIFNCVFSFFLGIFVWVDLRYSL